jgi:hypothetical protein
MNGSLDDMTHVSMVIETVMAKQTSGLDEMDVMEETPAPKGDDEQ